MKLLELRVDESIFNEVKDFLSILPKRKIKLREILNDSHIKTVWMSQTYEFATLIPL